MVTGIKDFQYRRNRLHTGSSSHSRSATLQIGNTGRESLARRVVVSRVLKALVHAGTLALLGRRRIDRRHNVAGARVRALAGLNGTGFKPLEINFIEHKIHSISIR
jgi:hypothetical protein